MTDHDQPPTVQQGSPPLPNWVWLSCLGLVLLKLWVTAGQTVFAIGLSPHDDSHFVDQALHLLRGEWLGPYGSTTLIKGPFFPAWIAATFVAGIPLLLSTQLLYAAACGLLCLAIRPLLKRNIYTPMLFAFLLFNPESEGVTRVLRELITPGLTLLVAASATGLFVRQNRRGAFGWAAGLGVSFAALWLTREEGMVVLPFLAFVFAGSIFAAWRSREVGSRWHVARTWLAGLLVWAVIVCAASATNLLYYGVFAKTEFDAYSFNAAYGALSRVKPPVFKHMVPVTRKTRVRIYRVSPAFSELKPYLEGRYGARWERMTEPMQDESNRREILGSWFQWALRDAVSRAGYYQHGRYPDEYYSRLAREVNEACAKRLLDCYAPRATFLPVWHNSYVRPLLATFRIKLLEVAGFRRVALDPIPSFGTPEELALFRELTGSRLTPPQLESVEIEAVGTNSEVRFEIKNPTGAPVPFSSSRGASPDFFSYLLRRGYDMPAAANAHYLLSAGCSDDCTLEIWLGGALQESFRFADLRPGMGATEKNEVIYRILSYEVPPAPLPEGARLSTARLAVLKDILRTYQLLNPIAAVVALLSYVLLTTILLRRRTGSRIWMVLTGLAILCSSRIALISFFSLTSVPVSGPAYLEEAYPIMLCFVGMSCLAAEEGLRALRPKKGLPT